MKLRTLSRVCSVLALVSGASGSALALNGGPHMWTVRAATTVLYDVGHGQEYGPYQPPQGVSQAEYALYLSEVARAYDKLIRLQSGLTWQVSNRTQFDGELACGYDQTLDLKQPDLIPISDFPFAFESRDYNLGCNMSVCQSGTNPETTSCPLPCVQVRTTATAPSRRRIRVRGTRPVVRSPPRPRTTMTASPPCNS